MTDSMGTVYRDLKPFLALARKYRLRFGLGFLLSLVTLLSSVGLLSLSGWFITATAVAGLTVATAQVFNFFTPGAGVRGFSIVRTAGRYGERLVTHDATFRLLAGLRIWFFEKVEPLAPAGLKGFRHSELLNRLVADIDTLDGLYLRLISPLLLALSATLALTLLAFLFSIKIGWFLLLVLALTMVLLPVWFFRLGQAPGEKTVQAREVLRNQIMDYVAGQTELQVYGATNRYQQKVTDAEQVALEHEQQMTRVTALSVVVIALLTGFTLSGVVLFGLLDLAGTVPAGRLQGPVIVMLTLAALAAFEAITPLPAAFQMLGQIHSATKRLRDVTEQKPVVVFPDEATGPEACTGALSFNKVSFAYPQGEPVLKEFNLELKAGERVALVGPTGCGKSSLLQLVTRDWLCEGEIALDGQPITRFTEQRLRRAMAVMPQRVHIFSASVRDNLLLAIDPAIAGDITDGDLISVLKRVGLTHIAPEDELLGLWLGAAGQTLSGGEQRRFGIARVLLRLLDESCLLVLLDEPTEGLDPETESRIITLLNEAISGKTLLMVTHRPAALGLVQRTLSLG